MQHLILLHGALGCRNDFNKLIERIPDETRVFAPNFPGHGYSPLVANFTIANFAEFVLGEMDKLHIPSADFFGYSMGGYVALWLAAHHPERVNRVITLGTKLRWDEQSAGHEMSRLNVQKMQEKIPAFCNHLAEKHGDDVWKEVVTRTSALMLDLGAGNALNHNHWKRIQCIVHMLRGSADLMMNADECVAVQAQIANCKYTELEGVPHPFDQVNIDQLLACF